MPRTWLSVDGQSVVLVRGFGRELVAWVCDAAGLAVLDALDGVEPPDELTDTRSFLPIRTGGLVRALLAADEALARGDPHAAVALLDVPLIWRAEEVQTAARLAEAWLQVGGGGLRKWLGLAGFCGVREGFRRGLGHDLPVGERAWTEEQLMALEARVREALG